MRRIVHYRAGQKHDPEYYARHTVAKAQAALQMRSGIVQSEDISILPFTKTDDDGVTFIDYLGGMQSEFQGPEDYFDFLRVHKELISKRLSEFSGSPVLQKYRWLRKYHNRVVRKQLSRKLHQKYCI